MSKTSSGSRGLVIDANVAIWTVLPVLANADVDALGRFSSWQHTGARLVAPALWLAECTSAIRRGVYAKAITHARGLVALSDLFALEVDIVPMDEDQCMSAFEWAGRLGQARAYDGFYMALAEQLGMEFWTADTRLANAAQQAGATWVHWVGESQ